MVSKKEKFNKSLFLIPCCLILFSCNESEFYEKEFLEGAGIDKDSTSFNKEVPKETPKVDDPKVDDPKIDDPKKDGPKKDDPPKVVITDPKVSDPKKDDPKKDGPKKDDPNPKKDDPVVVVDPKPIDPKIDLPKFPTVNLDDVTDLFTQNISEKGKVDILWVIDDSGSMNDEQKALAYNFDIFIHEFLEKKVDFTMAITTTDATSKRNGKMVGNPAHLTSEAASKNESKFYKDFARYIKVGTRGSGREKGLHTSLSFLKRYGNKFFRKEAYGIIVYVSDEEDQSSKKVEEYVNAYTSIKKNTGMIKIYSIVSKKKTRRWETVGKRYMKASRDTGGTSAHIKGDFYTILRDMGGKIVDLLDSFALSKDPYKSRLTVSVNGQVVSESHYKYDPVANTVKFNKDFLPSEGQKIKISYQVKSEKQPILLGSN